jgi:hypothetical protein
MHKQRMIVHACMSQKLACLSRITVMRSTHGCQGMSVQKQDMLVMHKQRLIAHTYMYENRICLSCINSA